MQFRRSESLAERGKKIINNDEEICKLELGFARKSEEKRIKSKISENDRWRGEIDCNSSEN
jgi:hypothetical protein